MRLEPRPRAEPVMPNYLAGMLLVIAVELMFFAGLVSAYLVARGQAVAWPPAGQPRLPIERTAANTMLLIASGWFALRALRLKDDFPTRAASALRIAAAGGAVFLLLQGYEWVQLIGFGLRTNSSLYGAFFYLIVGAHGLHALAGLIAILTVTNWSRRSETVASAAVFWLFVVAVWPVLYWLVYLS